MSPWVPGGVVLLIWELATPPEPDGFGRRVSLIDHRFGDCGLFDSHQAIDGRYPGKLLLPAPAS